MKNKRKKREAKISVTRKRITLISGAFLIFTAYLLSNLFTLQYLKNDYYKEKVYNQVTTSAPLKAERGLIYDSNMQLLATTKTEWRIFVSTKDIKKFEKESEKNYSEIIAKGLASILNLDYGTLLSKIKGSSTLDVTVKRAVEEEEYLKVLEFIKENELERLIFTEAQSSRYYPEGTLLAHVLGFTGSDNQGLYGLEYFYDDILSGKDGYYLYAKDAAGNALDTEYSSYVPPEPGLSIVTTIDSYLQKELEYQLETIVKNHGVENRATAVVMNTETGAILAMATSSPFNPNNPYELDTLSEKKLRESGLPESSDEYRAYKKELLELMWSNKAISETYEPGSTFKIVTVSAALDLRVATPTDVFSCKGYHEVGGWRIKCHKVTGHGSGFSLSYGLQMSCNPTMMQIAEKIGADNFYSYTEKFGYFEKTGIDLPSEAKTIFHKKENIGPTELATISFGQRFKVSVINHLRAISAVANGGNLVTPYLVEKIIDRDGNVIKDHESGVIRRVVSEEVARTLGKILEEGVSGEGGAKNARVPGYKVAAKTGTSQKFDVLDENGNSYLRISSTVAFAPTEDSAISVIIVVDEPSSAIKYGSYVAAPYVSAFLEKALPYLGYESSLVSEEIAVENYVGLTTEIATKKLKEQGLAYEIVGDGEFVLAQTPQENDVISSAISKIILYTEEKSSYTTVPSLVGLSYEEAIKKTINSGLNVRLSGSRDFGTVVSQSLPFGARVKRGEIIELEILICDFEG